MGSQGDQELFYAHNRPMNDRRDVSHSIILASLRDCELEALVREPRLPACVALTSGFARASRLQAARSATAPATIPAPAGNLHQVTSGPCPCPERKAPRA